MPYFKTLEFFAAVADGTDRFFDGWFAVLDYGTAFRANYAEEPPFRLLHIKLSKLGRILTFQTVPVPNFASREVVRVIWQEKNYELRLKSRPFVEDRAHSLPVEPETESILVRELSDLCFALKLV